MSQASIFPTASVELDRYYYVFYSVSNKNKNAIHMRLYDHNRNLVSEDTRTFTTMSALEFLKKATANNAIAVGSKTTSSDVDVAFFEAYQQGWNNKQQLQIMSDTNQNYSNPYSNANVIYDISSSSTQYLIAGVDKKVLYLDEGVYVFDHSAITDVNDEMKFRDTVENGGNDYNQNIWLDGIIGSTNAYKVLRVDDNTPDLQYYTANGVSGDIFILHNRLAYYVRVETNHLGQSVFSMATSLNGTYHWQPKIDFANKDYFFHMVHASNANTDFVLGTTIDNSGTAITDASYLEINGVPGNKGANEIYDLSGYPTPSDLYYFEANTANMGYQPHPTTGIDYSYNVTFDGDAILLNNALAPTVPFSNGKTYLFLQNDDSHLGKYLVFSTTHNDFSFNSTEVFSMGMPGYTGAYTLVTVTSSDSDLQYYKAQYYDASGIYKPDYQITSIPAYIVADAPFSMTVEKYLTTDLSYSFNFGDLSGALTSASTTFTETPPNTVTSLDFTINGVVSKPRVVYDNPTIYTIEVSGGAFYLNGHEAPRLYVFGSNPYIFDQTHVSNGNKQIVFTNPSDGSLYSDSGYSAYGTAGDVDGYSTLQFSSVTDVNYGTSDVSGNTISYAVPDYEYRVRIDANILGEYVYSISEAGDDSFSKQVDLDLSAQALYYFDTSEPSNALKPLSFGLDPDSSDAAASLDAYTTYSLATQGTSGAYVILDLRTYVFPTVTPSMDLYGLPKAYTGIDYVVSFNNETFSDYTYNISGDITHLTRSPTSYVIPKRSVYDVAFNFGDSTPSGVYTVSVEDVDLSFELQQVTWNASHTVTVIDERLAIDGVVDATLNLSAGYVKFDISSIGNYTFQLATDYEGSGGEYTTSILKTDNYYYLFDAPSPTTLYYYDPNNSNRGNVPYDATEKSVSLSYALSSSYTDIIRVFTIIKGARSSYSYYGNDVEIVSPNYGTTRTIGKINCIGSEYSYRPSTITVQVTVNGTDWVNANVIQESGVYTLSGWKTFHYLIDPISCIQYKISFTGSNSTKLAPTRMYNYNASVNISPNPTILYRGLKYKFNTNDSSNAGRELIIKKNDSTAYTDTNVIYTTGTAGSTGAYSTFIVPYDNTLSTARFYSDTDAAASSVTIS